MNILYVRKQERGAFWKRKLRELRDSFYWHNRVGFFCASLRTQAKVKRVKLDTVRKLSKEQIETFDTVIFNYECNFQQEGYPIVTSSKAVRELYPKLKDVPVVLLVSSPNANLIPDDKDMDLYELVFRREHFKDLDRYNLSPRNKKKIRTTTLSCPLIPANILNYSRINPAEYGYDTTPDQYDYAVFFLGQETSKKKIRTEIVQTLKNSDTQFFGGLHQDIRSSKNAIPGNLLAPRLSRKKFYEATRSSKINLALEGYGQFTYRHWECWALSAFMISSPSVNEVQLPFEASDGKHYITFETKDDLMDKIRFYLDHKTERERIAANGRELFKSEYNFHKHGKYIRDQIEKII